MAQYPVTKNPEELEAWKTMMDSMIKFISASTKLMNTINERALQGPPEDEGPPKPPCEVECLICGPTRSPKICQKCAALPAIGPAAPKPAVAAAPPPPKIPSIVITPPDDEPPAEEAPAEEPPADEPPADEPPADEPPAEEPPAEEETPPEEPPAEEAPPEEPPAEEAPAEEAPPEEAPPEEAPPPEDSDDTLDETQYLAPPAPVVKSPSQPIPATGGGLGAENCCCEEIKGLKDAARSLGVLPPAEGGEGGRPPCVCPKGAAPVPPPTPEKPSCVCSKTKPPETTPSAKSCCCQDKKEQALETEAAKQCICAAKREEAMKESEEPKKKCCCAEKREEDEKNKSASAGGPCGCGQSQNEGKPCGCGSNLDPPEPPLKLCACPPGDDEKEKLAAELIEKVDKAESEIQQLRQELQRLQYFQAAAKTPAATMYKEIMKDIYAGKCNPKKKPVLAPPAKLKRPGDSVADSPDAAMRSQSRSVVRMVTPAEQSAGCSPTCPSASTTPPATPAPGDLPAIVRSYSRSVDRTMTPAGAEGCSPSCPAATSTPKPGSDPRKGPMPPCLSKTGSPGSRRGSTQLQPGSGTPSRRESILRAQTQVATRGSTPSSLQSNGYGTPSPTQWNSLPSGNVTICTPSGGPDSTPMSDCEQYGCMEDEEQPDEDYCTDYNCDNDDCTLRPKEEKKETDDEEKETKDTEPTSSKTPSKASVTSKSASKASKTSAASKPEAEGEGEAPAEEGGEEEAPAEEAEE